jgi:ATP-binding cassette, subfamily B, multidrug efflux pump
VKTGKVAGAQLRGDSLKRVNAVEWGRGFGTLVRIIRMILHHPWRVAIAIGATFIAASLQLMIPRLLGRAVDEAQGVLAASEAGDGNALITTALILLAVSILRGLFTMLQNYFGESVGHTIGYELRLACYEKLQRLSFSFHDRIHTGDLITLGILDIDAVRSFFSTGFVRFFLLLVLIGVGAYLLISTDVVLGLVSLSFVPFVAWRSSVSRLRLRAIWLAVQEKLSIVSRVMDENLGGVRVVRAFAAHKHEMEKFDEASAVALDLAHKRTSVRVVNTSAMNFSFFLAMGLVLWVGGGKVAAGEMSVGTLTSFLAFMTILQMPVRQLGLLVNSFARASICGSRLFELLDLDLNVEDRPDAKDLVVNDGLVRFDNVSFSYPGLDDRKVLSGITFEAKRGETIGIVGPPGSGKSTLAHLIPRFYDVSGGGISIDGQDIRSVTLDSLRHAVGIVQQDSFLFTTSIENNIVYGDPWAKDERIERASESAQLHNYVLNLPNQYGTIVGERGVSLSGGQRQRLSIARILMLHPSVMIFDDSTAAIDAGTEQRIRSAIRRFADERVTIVISHRLSSLMHADKIYFIEDGRFVEEGTHAELLAKGGRYRALYDLQVNPGDDALLASGEAG